MRLCLIISRPVLQQCPGSDGILSKLEYTHETVAYDSVLFFPGAAARDWRGIILSESDSYRTGDASRGHARQSVSERHLGQFGDVRMSLQSMNISPRDFP